MTKIKVLSVSELKQIKGGGAWSDLGQVVGGMATGAGGGAGLGTAICGPACGIVGG